MGAARGEPSPPAAICDLGSAPDAGLHPDYGGEILEGLAKSAACVQRPGNPDENLTTSLQKAIQSSPDDASKKDRETASLSPKASI